MAEFTRTESQTVTANSNVLFNSTAVPCTCGKIVHRDGSGLFALKGKHRYYVHFNANISGATADTAVELSLTDNGESIPGGRIVVTPSAANVLNNVAVTIELPIITCCCHNISVKNTGASTVTVTDANIVIKGEC